MHMWSEDFVLAKKSLLKPKDMSILLFRDMFMMDSKFQLQIRNSRALYAESAKYKSGRGSEMK